MKKGQKMTEQGKRNISRGVKRAKLAKKRGTSMGIDVEALRAEMAGPKRGRKRTIDSDRLALAKELISLAGIVLRG